MELSTECFKHTTDRGERRIAFRFPARPDVDTLAKIKRQSARYRKMGSGQRSAWFLPIEKLAALIQELGRVHPLAILLEQHIEQPAQVTEDVVAETGAVDDGGEAADTSEEPGTGHRHKRQRRSARAVPTGACFACEYEIRMMRKCGRFCESPIAHTEVCGF